MGSNRIVILTALPLEAAAVRAHLARPVRHDLPAGTIVEEAELPGSGYTVCLVCTGPGNTQAAVVAERVISWADPADVLFVGIAGALRDDMPLGDVIAATRVEAYQGGKQTAGGFSARPETWDGAHRLLQVAQYVEAGKLWLKFLPGDSGFSAPGVHFKPVASGDVVKDTGRSPLAELLDSIYNDAVVIEMEGAGAARAAAHHPRVGLLVVRGISDRSDGTKRSSDVGGWQQRAARHAAAFALGVIAGLPAPSPADVHGTPTMPGPAAAPDWSQLDRAPAVSWRTDLQRAYATEPSTLELHLVPVDAGARLQAARLQTLWPELAQLGRARGLFSQAESVEGQPSSGGVTAFVRAARGGGTTGLAVLPTGQRAAWEPLPAVDGLSAAIFDPENIATRLTALLELLLAVPVPLPSQTVPVAGIAPAMLITRGTVSAPPRGAATIRMNGQPIRTEAVESVSTDGLRHATTQVAEELAARLDQSFSGPRR